MKLKYAYIFLSVFCSSCIQEVKNNITDTEKNKEISIKKPDSIHKDTIKQKEVINYNLPKYTMVSYNEYSPNCIPDSCLAYVKTNYPEFSNENYNTFVKQILDLQKYSTTQEGVTKEAKNFIKEYLDIKAEFSDTRLGYTWNQDLTPTFFDGEILAFTLSNAVYTGGAHGLENITYSNYNVTTNKVITLEMLFKKDFYNELQKIAEQIFRKNEGLKTNENYDEYFFENSNFSLTTNFIITKDGIKFTYNPYEIKAYVYGMTDLFIPYSKINHLINTKGPLAKYKK